MKKSEVVAKLTDFGLTKFQARLYVAGLSLGPTLMAILAREANVRRTTSHYLMDELQRRKFFSTRKIGRRKYYIAATPEQLIEMTKNREQLVRSVYNPLKSFQKEGSF